MAVTVVKDTGPVFTLPGNTTATKFAIGDLVYWDSANSLIKKADASAASTYAEFVVVIPADTGKADEVNVGVSRKCLLTDEDSSTFTAGGTIYLSETAGGNTQTRPTTTDALVQVVGTAISAQIAIIEIALRREMAVDAVFASLIGSAAAYGVVDTTLVGLELQDGSANAIGRWSLPIPENVVGVKTVWLYHASDEVLDSSDDHKILAYAGGHDQPHDSATDTLTTTDWSTTAADDINRRDVASAFDASGLVDPGSLLTFSIEKEEEGTGGEDPIIIGWQFVFEVV